MTNEELRIAQDKLTQVDTEIAGLEQQARDFTDKAREFNDLNRERRRQIVALQKAVDPLRVAVAQHIQAEAAERKRLAAEKAKADADAKANEPQPKTEVQLLHEKIDKLTEQLAANTAAKE